MACTPTGIIGCLFLSAATIILPPVCYHTGATWAACKEDVNKRGGWIVPLSALPESIRPFADKTQQGIHYLAGATLSVLPDGVPQTICPFVSKMRAAILSVLPDSVRPILDNVRPIVDVANNIDEQRSPLLYLYSFIFVVAVACVLQVMCSSPRQSPNIGHSGETSLSEVDEKDHRPLQSPIEAAKTVVEDVVEPTSKVAEEVVEPTIQVSEEVVEEVVEPTNEVMSPTNLQNTWSDKHAYSLGESIPSDKIKEIENEHGIKVEEFDHEQYPSVTEAVKALNSGVVQCPTGICIVRSERQKLYFLVARDDRKDWCTTNFPIDESWANPALQTLGRGH